MIVLEAPPAGSDEETICHVAATHPDWQGKRIAAYVGRHPSFVHRTLQRYGRRLRGDRIEVRLGLTEEQRKSLAAAADLRSIRFDALVERLLIVIASEPALVDNILDDRGAP